MPNEEIEGRLVAQREALAFLIAHVARMEERYDEHASRLLRVLEAHSLFQDHQEDPGAVPSGGAFAVEAAAKSEFRRILSDAQEQIPSARPGG
ncbi:hypothetical protein [Chelativorans sp. AA-79]|uniref:hypothetical protein n=1 Tax=Chelativorans sp. AA-79 TaxID=3028735 RepID=UPI0023F8D9F7|nr:hypothetical protein [Chelativorans sp. AA-79]WEX10188.1 hypothetical protein PVE73_04310 [Chelativorans sp. AA-79]